MMTDDRCPIITDVAQAASAIRSGKLVAFATETVYGLGADALNEVAVARIFAAKQRPEFDPLIVHIADRRWLPKLTSSVHPLAEKLADAFWPGALTLILPKREIVPDLVTSGIPSVGIRMPSHPLAIEFLLEADRPIAAPSANPFGRISPTTAKHVAKGLGTRIDFILDGGACDVGVESTVVSVLDNVPTILRHGGITQEQIEQVIGPVLSADSTQPDSPAIAPGQLPSHYAPATRLEMAADVDWPNETEGQIAALVFDDVAKSQLLSLAGSVELSPIIVLSPSADLTEAAAKFFSALRELDASPAELIVATPFPEHSLGRALNDRLRRACHRS
jgi:L-threonylcarbamoyladenylate synthase